MSNYIIFVTMIFVTSVTPAHAMMTFGVRISKQPTPRLVAPPEPQKQLPLTCEKLIELRRQMGKQAMAFWEKDLIAGQNFR
ncbi:MAG TPA: hypothetical protein VGT41_06110 [Candidatus Babeliales bacterium]|nr:hypothetical protein [Candidatus Babeliales bacterium]